MKSREVIKILEANGWYFHKQVGSHRHFKHYKTHKKTTVPIHGSKDITIGTLKNISKQTGIKF